MAAKKEAPKKAPAEEADAAAAPPKKSGKLLKILVLLLVAGGGGGGGAYWFLVHNKSAKPVEAKPVPPKPPVFLALEPFTVNLQVEDNPQFLQTGLSLEVADNTVVDALKVHMPKVRDRILLLLSSRKPSELLTVQGKEKLGADIADLVNIILDPPPPKPKEKAKAKAKAPAKDGEETQPATEAAPQTAEVEGKPEEEGADAAPAAPAVPKKPVVAVLFTSFIVQ